MFYLHVSSEYEKEMYVLFVCVLRIREGNVCFICMCPLNTSWKSMFYLHVSSEYQ